MSRSATQQRAAKRAAFRRRSRRAAFTVAHAGAAWRLVRAQLGGGGFGVTGFQPEPVRGSLEWAYDVIDGFTPAAHPDDVDAALEIALLATPTGRASDHREPVITLAPVAEQEPPAPSSPEGQRLTRRRITAILRRDGRRLGPDTITASRAGLFTVPAPGSVEWAHDVADGFTPAPARDRRWALSILTPNAARAA